MRGALHELSLIVNKTQTIEGWGCYVHFTDEQTEPESEVGPEPRPQTPICQRTLSFPQCQASLLSANVVASVIC